MAANPNLTFCPNGCFQLTPSPPLPVSLSLEDSELLCFYSSQSLAHLSCLADAIDVLFTSVRGNQPPRIFVARGKSLIVTAHKLVFIGDTLSRLLTSGDLRAKVLCPFISGCRRLMPLLVLSDFLLSFFQLCTFSSFLFLSSGFALFPASFCSFLHALFLLSFHPP